MYRNSSVICNIVPYRIVYIYHWAPLFPIATDIHVYVPIPMYYTKKATKKTTNTNNPNKIKSKFIRNKRESIEIKCWFYISK